MPALELFIAVLGSLFSIVNPIGAIPIFLALSPDYTVAERRRSAMFTSIYVIAILMVFFFAGTAILSFFGISLSAMRIAGGLVILSSGYSLLAGKFAESRAINEKVRDEALEKDDISFTPLAMPMLAGPGSISYLIGLWDEYPDWSQKFTVIGVVLAMGLIIFLVLRSAPFLNRFLGVSGIRAMSRIIGFIVMAIGVQLIIGGVVKLVSTMV